MRGKVQLRFQSASKAISAARLHRRGSGCRNALNQCQKYLRCAGEKRANIWNLAVTCGHSFTIGCFWLQCDKRWRSPCVTGYIQNCPRRARCMLRKGLRRSGKVEGWGRGVAVFRNSHIVLHSPIHHHVAFPRFSAVTLTSLNTALVYV